MFILTPKLMIEILKITQSAVMTEISSHNTMYQITIFNWIHDEACYLPIFRSMSCERLFRNKRNGWRTQPWCWSGVPHWRIIKSNALFFFFEYGQVS